MRLYALKNDCDIKTNLEGKKSNGVLPGARNLPGLAGNRACLSRKKVLPASIPVLPVKPVKLPASSLKVTVSDKNIGKNGVGEDDGWVRHSSSLADIYGKAPRKIFSPEVKTRRATQSSEGGRFFIPPKSCVEVSVVKNSNTSAKYYKSKFHKSSILTPRSYTKLYKEKRRSSSSSTVLKSSYEPHPPIAPRPNTVDVEAAAKKQVLVDQRRMIYALNSIMSEFEHKQHGQVTGQV